MEVKTKIVSELFKYKFKKTTEDLQIENLKLKENLNF